MIVICSGDHGYAKREPHLLRKMSPSVPAYLNFLDVRGAKLNSIADCWSKNMTNGKMHASGNVLATYDFWLQTWLLKWRMHLQIEKARHCLRAYRIIFSCYLQLCIGYIEIRTKAECSGASIGGPGWSDHIHATAIAVP